MASAQSRPALIAALTSDPPPSASETNRIVALATTVAQHMPLGIRRTYATRRIVRRVVFASRRGAAGASLHPAGGRGETTSYEEERSMGETVDLPDRDMWESDEMQETLVDQAHRNKAIVTRLFEEVAYPPRPDIDVLDEIIAPHARHADRHLP